MGSWVFEEERKERGIAAAVVRGREAGLDGEERRGGDDLGERDHVGV